MLSKIWTLVGTWYRLLPLFKEDTKKGPYVHKASFGCLS